MSVSRGHVFSGRQLPAFSDISLDHHKNLHTNPEATGGHSPLELLALWHIGGIRALTKGVNVT